MGVARVCVLLVAAVLLGCEYSARPPKFNQWEIVSRKVDGARCQIVREPQGSVHYPTWACWVRCQAILRTETHLIGADGPLRFEPGIQVLYEEELEANG